MTKLSRSIAFTFCFFALFTQSPKAYASGPLDDVRSKKYIHAELLEIPLEWNPSEKVGELDMTALSVYLDKTISVKPFNDLRKNKTEIGRNKVLDPDKELLVTTKDDVGKWLTAMFTQTLEDYHVQIDQTNGDVLLEADIVRFQVLESSSYKAELLLKVYVKSRTGALLWEGMVLGTSNKQGISYKASNYYEGLSNACISAVYRLLGTESLKLALQKK